MKNKNIDKFVLSKTLLEKQPFQPIIVWKQLIEIFFILISIER